MDADALYSSSCQSIVCSYLYSWNSCVDIQQLCTSSKFTQDQKVSFFVLRYVLTENNQFPRESKNWRSSKWRIPQAFRSRHTFSVSSVKYTGFLLTCLRAIMLTRGKLKIFWTNFSDLDLELLLPIFTFFTLTFDL